MNLNKQLFGNEFPDEQFYETARMVLGPSCYHCNQYQLEETLLDKIGGLTESETEAFVENFKEILKKAGSGALKFISRAAPLLPIPGGGLITNTISKFADLGANALDRKAGSREALRQQWRQTKGDIRKVGGEIKNTLQQYDANNPTALSQPVAQDLSTIQNYLAQFMAMLTNPQLQLGAAQQTVGAVAPDMPNSEGYSFSEMVEAIYDVTGEMMKDYYENGYIPQDEYAFNRQGQLMPLNSHRRNQLSEAIFNYR